MKIDAAIRRTRDARRGISASVGDDPVKIVEYYIQMQKRFAARLRSGPGDARGDGGMAEPSVPPDAPKAARG